MNVPTNWSCQKKAGLDWLHGFLLRHPSLSIRKPQATSLSRATSFNHHNVKEFYDNLDNVLSREGITTTQIWNVDETGITTVHRPDGIIARKGRKQIGAVTSAERGTLITMALAVSSCGTSIPPFFVFPRLVKFNSYVYFCFVMPFYCLHRVHFRSFFLNGAPLGSAGSANKSGWMTELDFDKFLEHFIRHARPSVQNKIVLLLDNHSSHLSINGLRIAKENGIILLSFPPHCSHKLQPLDRTVFGPFKGYFNSAAGSWMKDHPGAPMTISDVAAIVGIALPLAATPTNISSGFRVAGIVPFNRFIFENDTDFAPSFVTDREAPVQRDNVVDDEILLTMNIEEGQVSLCWFPVIYYRLIFKFYTGV